VGDEPEEPRVQARAEPPHGGHVQSAAALGIARALGDVRGAGHDRLQQRGYLAGGRLAGAGDDDEHVIAVSQAVLKAAPDRGAYAFVPSRLSADSDRADCSAPTPVPDGPRSLYADARVDRSGHIRGAGRVPPRGSCSPPKRPILSGLLLEGIVRERVVDRQAPAHRTRKHPRRAGDQRVCLAAVLAAQAPVRAELRVSRPLAQTDETHRAAALQAAQQSEQVAGQSGATVAELRRLDVLDLPPADHGAGVCGAELVHAGVGVGGSIDVTADIARYVPRAWRQPESSGFIARGVTARLRRSVRNGRERVFDEKERTEPRGAVPRRPQGFQDGTHARASTRLPRAARAPQARDRRGRPRPVVSAHGLKGPVELFIDESGPREDRTLALGILLVQEHLADASRDYLDWLAGELERDHPALGAQAYGGEWKGRLLARSTAGTRQRRAVGRGELLSDTSRQVVYARCLDAIRLAPGVRAFALTYRWTGPSRGPANQAGYRIRRAVIASTTDRRIQMADLIAFAAHTSRFPGGSHVFPTAHGWLAGFVKDRLIKPERDPDHHVIEP